MRKLTLIPKPIMLLDALCAHGHDHNWVAYDVLERALGAVSGTAALPMTVSRLRRAGIRIDNDRRYGYRLRWQGPLSDTIRGVP